MVRKLLLLSLILTLSWNSFSQNVTDIRDTSRITLSTDVARRVATELIQGDEAIQEVELLTKEVQEYRQLVELQDSLGNARENQIRSLQKIIELQEIQTQSNLQEYDRLTKEIGKQITYKTIFATTAGISTIALITSLLMYSK